jgi:hypothetical protein
MGASYAATPAELVFPPQAAFSWTLRSARARRTKASEPARRSIHYRIAGSAADWGELAAAIAYCRHHRATLDWHRPASR